jgi:hypothetical protein
MVSDVMTRGSPTGSCEVVALGKADSVAREDGEAEDSQENHHVIMAW